MSYRIKISENTEKGLRRIPKKEKERIIQKIDLLAENPKPKDCKKLKGTKKLPLYRIRSGKYRIIYTIRDEILLILVVEIGHRKDMYKT